MKQAFFEYNMKSGNIIDNIKKDGIIVLDANVLLNIYRFNKDNREKYFNMG
ncbi:hypothetical protein [Candidatus Clostridium radicumherbarum]|uniref:PIN like domain-containing protein n=1 Tax=Candidatus Clostridium radicumherbarum TaxID=3381662 RepID=A0ABW8TUV4_9CLOT